MKKIMFIQGLGMTKHEWNNSFDEIAGRLHEAGFDTLQFELPIFVHGQTREMPLRERAKFVGDVARRYKPDGIIAQSYGALTALVSHFPSVRSEIFISPALRPDLSLVKVYEEKGVTINYTGETTLPRKSGENTTVTKEFWEDVKNFNGIQSAGTITTPICIFHGDNDTKIPVAAVETFYAAIPVKQKKLKIFTRGDHGISDVPRPMREELLSDIVMWLKETV